MGKEGLRKGEGGAEKGAGMMARGGSEGEERGKR
jgi:hypothetical protein